MSVINMWRPSNRGIFIMLTTQHLSIETAQCEISMHISYDTSVITFYTIKDMHPMSTSRAIFLNIPEFLTFHKLSKMDVIFWVCSIDDFVHINNVAKLQVANLGIKWKLEDIQITERPEITPELPQYRPIWVYVKRVAILPDRIHGIFSAEV